MNKEELEEFLEMVQRDAWIDEYGFGPFATKEDISKFYNRFEELQNKLYTALEDYQLHKEILNDYGFTLANFREACFLLAQFRGSGFTGIENKLKAFEIIKEKEIDVPLLKESDNVEDYNYWCHPNSQLELEQYTLLKEMLKNERM